MIKTRRALGATLVTGAVLALAACGGHKTAPTSTAAASKSPATMTPAASPTGSTSISETPVATNDRGLPVVAPAPDSPALTNFTVEQTTAAMEFGQIAAIDTISNTTLVLQQAHTLPDFSTAEQYLTPGAQTIFEGYVDSASGTNGDMTAAQSLFAYAFFQSPGSAFTPDEPVVITGQDITIDPTVGVDTGIDGAPRMNISGSVDVGFVGADPAKGGHGIMVISRTFTYAVVPTGNADQPYAIDSWTGNTNYADTVKPYTAQ